jgi:hypothetical protein
LPRRKAAHKRHGLLDGLKGALEGREKRQRETAKKIVGVLKKRGLVGAL